MFGQERALQQLRRRCAIFRVVLALLVAITAVPDLRGLASEASQWLAVGEEGPRDGPGIAPRLLSIDGTDEEIEELDDAPPATGASIDHPSHRRARSAAFHRSSLSVPRLVRGHFATGPPALLAA